MEDKKGITIISLVITIIIMLLLATIVVNITINENGIIKKAEKANYNQAVSEMYERLNENITYMEMKGRINNDKEINLNKIYSSKKFNDIYEIKGKHIYDRIRKIELVKKQEFEKYVEDKLGSEINNPELNITDTPSITTIKDEDNVLRGKGKKNSDITIYIGTNTYTGKVDNNGDFSITIPKQPSGTIIKVSQKEEGKNESEKIPVEVYKTRLGKITIDNVVNTDTKITGKAKPKADVKLVINGREYTGKADDTGKFDIQVSSLSDGDVVVGTQSFGDKITSEEEKVTVGIGKGQKPLVNEITTEDTAVIGKADPRAKIRVILEDDTEYIGFADGSRKLQCNNTNARYEQEDKGNTNSSKKRRIRESRGNSKRSTSTKTKYKWYGYR